MAKALASLQKAKRERDAEHGRLMTMSVDKLIEDPDNKVIYDDYKIEGLTDSIKSNGFDGYIYVYPSENGLYMIESGHRSYNAAISAGLNEVQVIVRSAPKSEVERRKRLVHANLHTRKRTPLVVAKEAVYLIKTYQMENGLDEDLHRIPSDISKKVASDLEISTSKLAKYLQVLKLVPDLQKIAEEGSVSWTSLAAAASLSTAVQEKLVTDINNKIKLEGEGSATQDWLDATIKEFKTLIEHGVDPTAPKRDINTFYDYNKLPSTVVNVIENSKNKTPKRERRVDGVKAIRNARSYIEKGCGEDALVRNKSIPQVIEDLEVIEKIIKKKIAEYKNML